MKKTVSLLLAVVLALSLGGCGIGQNGRAYKDTAAQNAPEGTKGVDISLDNWRTFMELVQKVEPVYENGEVSSLSISWYLKLKDEYVIENEDGTNSNEIDLSGQCALVTQTVKKAVWNEADGTFEINDPDPENEAESDVSETEDFVMTDIISDPIVEGSEGIFGEMTVDGDSYSADCDTYLYAEITRIKGSIIVKQQG